MSANDLPTKARSQRKPLNEPLRRRPSSGAAGQDRGKAYRDVMKRLSYVRPGKRLTRDELNER